MSVAGYIGKTRTELTMKGGRRSGLGIMFLGPVLRGDKTVEQGRREDVILASINERAKEASRVEALQIMARIPRSTIMFE